MKPFTPREKETLFLEVKMILEIEEENLCFILEEAPLNSTLKKLLGS